MAEPSTVTPSSSVTCAETQDTAAEWHLGSRVEVGAPREWPWFISVMLLSGELRAMPGTLEQKLGVSWHRGGGAPQKAIAIRIPVSLSVHYKN